MKKIFIDITKLNSNNKNAILGIKYFFAKNPKSEILVLGENKNTSTISKKDNIKILDIYNSNIKILDEFKEIKNKNFQILFSILKTYNLDSFVTFYTYEELKPYIEKYFIKIKSPLLVASYSNLMNHKVTLLGDIGYNLTPSHNDYINYLEQMNEYIKNVFNIEKPTFKFLSTAITKDEKLLKSFESKESFKGILSPKEIYTADTDLLIGNAPIVSASIEAINGAINTYDKFINNSINKHIGYKIMSPTFKGIFAQFHLEIDQKIVSGGTTLLGFNKKIVFINNDFIPMGVKASLDVCSKI